MNTLITKRFNLQFSHQNFVFHFPPIPKKTPHHINPFPRKSPYTAKKLALCSVSASESLSCGGWDDPQFISDTTVHHGESNQLHNFLKFLGLNDKKYLFVYILGFVCALAISRVKVSSILAIPGCVMVFALGVSIGFVNGGKMSLDGSKRLSQDKILRGFVDKLRNLMDFLNGFDVEIGNLKKGVRKGIECSEITVNDLESFVKILESMNLSASNARMVVEGCIGSVSNEGQEMERNFSQKSSKIKKEPGKYGIDLSQFAAGLFKSKSGKTKECDERELMDTEMNGSKQGLNILTSANKDRHSDSSSDMNVESINGTSRRSFDDAIRRDKEDVAFGKASRMNLVSDENAYLFETDINTVKSVFNKEEYSSWTNRVQYTRNQRVSLRTSHPSEFEAWASDDGLVDSMDFSVNMERTKTEASFLHEQKVENLEGMNSNFGGIENDEETYRPFLREQMSNHDKETSMASNEAANDSEFGSSPASEGSIDLQFNKYLTEANILVKQAKDCLRQQGSDKYAENAFDQSAILLSKAIDIRPMSLLAVGQLGNTYLLHGELKLRISRDLRALLTDSLSVNKRTKMRNGLDDLVPRKDKITSYLVNVCEECEELLTKAGRQYRLALSIDGNDMRALYNWGLALNFRAQLIADIGPGAARDADKVFLAAIDKFDAMMSKGNVYAPDALFRWATALQHRSRLRPRTSREKVKLLKQAQRLYEDALQMDSDNFQVQEALSSCISEFNYWYR